MTTRRNFVRIATAAGAAIGAGIDSLHARPSPHVLH
ncbi:MAG: twin-arginine translocation signal domain-containing protein, partial [Longimicrobiales bacterium]